MSERITQGAIIAAGEGSRLKRDGFAAKKPLVPVAGVPLVEHVVSCFEAAGIAKISVIFNEDEEDCAAFVRRRFPHLDLAITVRTTPSSLVSFGVVLTSSGEGRTLVSTVDAFCAPVDFIDFARRAERRPVDATVLGVTPLVADEKPLWVTLGADGAISRVGTDAGSAVTAGLYVVSDRARRHALEPPASLGRLREFLSWLAEGGEPMYGEMIEKVVDVDRAEDVALAEDLARTLPAVGASS